MNTVNTTASLITYATNWTMQAQRTYTTTNGVRNAVANRSVPVTNTTDVSSTAFGTTSLASMTGMSLKAAPTPTFTGLTASQSICFGTATVTLSGTVSAAGSVYPANGETVGVTINGVTQNATIAGGVGGFSINFTSATIPSSGTPYTITYSYAGGGNLKAAVNNTSTALTVNSATAISSQSTGAQTQCSGGTFSPISVAATGGGLTYQWYSNASASTTGGTSLGSGNGAQTSSYTPQASNAGTLYYYCIVSGTCGSATSAISGAFIVIPSIGNNSLDFTNGQHGTVCGTAAEDGNAVLTAPLGTVFINVGFASYGTPTGTCPTFTITGACHALTSQSVTEGYLLGNNTASIPATNAVFGDPCSGTVKILDVLATYTEPICSGNTPGTISGALPNGGNGIFTYLWESSTTSSSSGFVPATGTYNTQNYTPGSPLTQTTWYRRKVTSGACNNTSTTIQLTVNALPTITGTLSVCAGLTTQLTGSATAAAVNPWVSATPAVATVNSTGLVTGVSAGTSVITYTNTNGCFITATVTVNALPTVAAIAGGAATVCVNATTPAFTDATAGGTWSITPGTGTASITAGGVVTGLTAGTVTVVYTYSNGTCSNTATQSLTVNSLPTITGQPASPAAVCSGTNSSTFTVAATGTGLNYQWQRGISGNYVNITGGTTPNDGCTYSGYTGATLTITNALSGMNGYTYQCVISGTCTPSVTSNGNATLTVSTAPVITGQPVSPAAVCAGTARTFTITATGTGLTYQWQRGIAGTYTNITAATTPNDGCTYSGFTGVTLTITNPTVGMNGYTYRCVVSSGACSSTSDGNATLSINAAPAITGQPSSPPTVIAGTNSSTFTVTATGAGLTYQWQRSNGGTYVNITAAKTPIDGVTGTSYSGFLTATLTVANASSGMNNYTYRCVVTGTCAPAVTSTAGTLTVLGTSCITANPQNVTICSGASTSFSIAANGATGYQWQVSTNGGGTFTNITAAGQVPTYSGSIIGCVVLELYLLYLH